MLLSSYMFFIVARATNISLVDRFYVSNLVYFVLLTFPWLLLVKAKYFRYILIVITAFAIFVSMKRTAILAFSLGILFYFFIENKLWEKNIKIVSILFTFLLISGISYMYVKIDSYTGGYITTRFQNIEDDRGSGRLDIYNNVIELQSNTHFENWVVGHGHNSLLVFNKNKSAHNDFLEVLFDYGLIGLILYIMLHLLLIKKTISLIKLKSEFASGFLVSYIIFFVMSMISHLILYPSYFIYLAAYWGAIFAISENSPFNTQFAMTSYY